MTKKNKKIIVFYDDTCGLCNSFIEFLLDNDKKKCLFFAPLQGTTAKKELPEKYTKNTRTVVVKINQKLFVKSDAVLYLYNQLGGFWRTFIILKIIPRPVRDWSYDIISKNRNKMDKHNSNKICRVLTKDQQKRFLK